MSCSLAQHTKTLSCTVPMPYYQSLSLNYVFETRQHTLTAPASAESYCVAEIGCCEELDRVLVRNGVESRR